MAGGDFMDEEGGVFRAAFYGFVKIVGRSRPYFEIVR
jgi:hypothetical protein